MRRPALLLLGLALLAGCVTLPTSGPERGLAKLQGFEAQCDTDSDCFRMCKGDPSCDGGPQPQPLKGF